MKPKFDGAKALISAVDSCDPPCDLDFLFLASTIAALFGNAGQANYAAGCAQLDALANSRASSGKPTFSVNIGSLGGVGFVAANVSVQRALKLRGLHPMQPDAFLAAIEQIIRSDSLGKVRVSAFVRVVWCGRQLLPRRLSAQRLPAVLTAEPFYCFPLFATRAPRFSFCRWARRMCTSSRRSGSASLARR